MRDPFHKCNPFLIRSDLQTSNSLVRNFFQRQKLSQRQINTYNLKESVNIGEFCHYSAELPHYCRVYNFSVTRHKIFYDQSFAWTNIAMNRFFKNIKSIGSISSVFIALIVLLACASSSVYAASKGHGAIAKSARLGGDATRTRFVTDLSKPVDFNVFTLPNPYRVIVDLPAVKFHLPDGVGRRGKGLVTAFRYGLFAADKSRIVIDVNSPVIVEKAYVLPATDGQPPRLILDIVATTQKGFEKARSRQKRRVSKKTDRIITPPVAPSLLSTGRPKGTRPVVVIDPGHGGIDSGAIGITKSKEKTSSSQSPERCVIVCAKQGDTRL